MAQQYLALVEETTRGTDPGSGYDFYPVDTLEPDYSPNDTMREEFRGPNTALGYATAIRRASSFTFPLSGFWYPSSAILDKVWKHLCGYAVTRQVTDTTAYRGLFYPVENPYGDGSEPLGQKAIGFFPNTDENGTTMSRHWGGARPTEAKFTFDPGADIKISVSFSGPSGYIGAEDTAIPSPSMPQVSPFVASDLKCYIGGAASLTGTSPDYTNMAPGTMNQFKPDNLELTVTNGLSDKNVLDGVEGATRTTRPSGSRFGVKASFKIDYTDPNSGWSPADAHKLHLTSIQYLPLMLVLEHSDLAGATTEHYGAVMYMPKMRIVTSKTTRAADGSIASEDFELESMNDTTYDEKPFFMMTINQNDVE